MTPESPKLEAKSHQALTVDFDPTIPEDTSVPEELRRERGKKTLAEHIADEGKLQMEYAFKQSFLLQLQEVVQQTPLPDFSRVSATIPEAVRATIQELASDNNFPRLSLYRSAGRENIIRELETLVRRNTFDTEIDRLRSLIEASKERLENLKARQAQEAYQRTVLEPFVSDENAVQDILAKLQSMPKTVETPSRTTEPVAPQPITRGILDRAKRLFGI